jgi:hypothetical protein
MTTSRRPARMLLSFASLVVAVSATTAACSSGSSSSSTSSSGKSNVPASVKLKHSADCFRSHGVAAAKATGKDLRAEFAALPLSQQQAVYAACSSYLPVKTRNKIEEFMATETSTTM